METSAQTQAAAPRRARVALACQRCKGRKQRCDGGHPSCKSCLKAGTACVYEPTLRPRYPGGKMLYINALEERIAFLEAQLPQHGRDHFGQVDPTKGFRRIHRRNTIASTNSQPDNMDEEDSTLVDGVAYLSLCATGATNTVPEPFYLGSSSGAKIARLIQTAIFRGRKSVIDHTPLNTLRSPSISSANSSILTPSTTTALYEYPPPSHAQQLFSVFFNRLHTRWPILDRKLYEQIYERQYEQGVLPVIERSVLHLIYAISARFLQLTKQSIHVDPESHFMAALEPMDLIMEQHSSATVQFLALLAIYGQRSPYGAGVWSQVRYAITLCVELGLHRRPTTHSPVRDPRESELRKRVFWSCYCLDRLTSMLLGRTFAISDRDINVELPSDDPAFWNLTSNQAPLEDDTGWSHIMPFIHITRLRQLQSKIQRTVFRVDKDHELRSPEDHTREAAKVAKIRDDLDTWLSNIPDPPPAVEGGPRWMYQPDISTNHDSRDFFMLQYHKTVLSLYTASLPSLDVHDQRFLSCAQSAALICTTYKRLNQQKILSFTIIGLHSCFVAGLTLIYCLWRDGMLFNFDILEATRSCSQCLTIFGEKWPGAVKYGEIFEALSSSVLRAIIEPTQGNTRNPRISLDLSTEPSTLAAAEAERPKPVDPLLGAVKDVFMEADEDVPGGWQGWRVFNEMVQSDIQEPGLATGNVAEPGLMSSDFMVPTWGDGVTFTSPDFDVPSVRASNAFGNQSGWDRSFFAGYE